MTETPTPKSKPFYLRLLPWLAGLMVVLCLVAACEPFLSQYRTVKAILNKGGYVMLEAPAWIPEFIQNKLDKEQTYFIYEAVGVVDTSRIFGDTEMKLVSRFTHMKHLELSGSHVSNNGLKHLSGLTNLQSLNLLGCTQIRNDSLNHLSGLANLDFLHLGFTDVSNDGLKHLSGLTNLRTLSLHNTKVRNDGLKHLSGLIKLQWLNLDNTQVSDASLKHLVGMTDLEYLFLRDTKVSPAGVKQLQMALPKCMIIRLRD